MKIIATVLFALLLPATDAAALERWGPTWSEVTGTRYFRATMNRAPAIIKSVDGRNYTDRIVKIEPGKRMVVVQSPPRKGFQGSNKHMTMDIAPYGNEFVLHGLGTTEQGIDRHTEVPYQREHATFQEKYWSDRRQDKGQAERYLTPMEPYRLLARMLLAAVALTLHLDDLELHTIRPLEEADAAASARGHLL